MELFDTHADEVFASFIARGYSRTEALAATEHYFLKVYEGGFMIFSWVLLYSKLAL